MAETFLEMAQRHQKADMLEAGHFEMKNGRACSIGCFNHDLGNNPDDFQALAEWTGYPVDAHRLQEVIFEGLPPEAARKNWHVRFAEKAETVTDWDKVLSKTTLAALRIALLRDTSEGKVVEQVIALYERRLAGDEPERSEWAAAADAALGGAVSCAARSASRHAALAARWAACSNLAWSAAAAAESAGPPMYLAWAQIRDAFLKA